MFVGVLHSFHDRVFFPDGTAALSYGTARRLFSSVETAGQLRQLFSSVEFGCSWEFFIASVRCYWLEMVKRKKPEEGSDAGEAKEKNCCRSRSSVHRIVNMVEDVSKDFTHYVHAMGFFGVTKIKLTRLPPKFIQWASDHYDIESRSILLAEGRKFRITVDDVRRVYGIPEGDKPVCFNSPLNPDDMKNYKWRSHIADWFNDGMVKSKGDNYIEANIHLLLVSLCDKMGVPGEIPFTTVPTCKHWDIDTLNKKLSKMNGYEGFEKAIPFCRLI
ncbi:hypothetical protein LINPERPRIM_LOCUS13306 [Linum perenne]